MLVRHAQTAQSMGVPEENMVIIDNGDVVELSTNKIEVAGKVPSGIELVDSSRQGVVDRDTLRDRQQLAEDGIVTVSAIISTKGKLAASPGLDIRGISQSLDVNRFQRQIADAISRILRERSRHGTVEVEGIQAAIETEIRRLVRKELPKRSPVVVPLLQWVELAPEKASTGRTSAAVPALSAPLKS